jgi:hypothetical protein
MQVATSEVVRDINKRVVLNLIRTRQPISRADLARASGLQRSTVSLIVEELVTTTGCSKGPLAGCRAVAVPPFCGSMTIA